MRADTILCIMAKPPQAGLVKTRLIPAVGAAGAARLADALLTESLHLARSAGWADVVLASTELGSPALAKYHRTEQWHQGQGDLGARIQRMLLRGLQRRPRAMVMGADSPGLPLALVNHARKALDYHDAVLGPTEDGGFYLLGVRQVPSLLNIGWSEKDTFIQTYSALVRQGFSVAVLEPWFDIDIPADLLKLTHWVATGKIKVGEELRIVLDSLISTLPVAGSPHLGEPTLEPDRTDANPIS